MKGNYIYITRDKNYGNAITDIENINDFKSIEITAKQWTDMVIATGDNASTRSYMIESDDYKAMTDSKDVYVIKSIYSEEDEDTGIVITSLKDELKNKESSKKELIETAIADAGPAKEEEEAEQEEAVPDSQDETGTDENAEGEGSDGTDAEDSSDQFVVEPSADSDEEVGDSESGEVDNTYNEGDVSTETGETEENGENVDGVGTVKEDSGRFPGTVEVIIFIILAISIPVATFLIKRKFGVKKKNS